MYFFPLQIFISSRPNKPSYKQPRDLTKPSNHPPLSAKNNKALQKMAGFVTANRWATGVETHKTSEGRILCTGVGCVGCFPDVFSKEANELGVCDVDLSGGILGLRPFLDEGNSRENLKMKGKKFSRRRKKRKPKTTQNTETNDKKVSFQGYLKIHETDREKSGDARPSEAFKIGSIATQTEPYGLEIDSQIVRSEILNDQSKQDVQPLDEGNRSDTEETLSDNHRQVSAN